MTTWEMKKLDSTTSAFWQWFETRKGVFNFWKTKAKQEWASFMQRQECVSAQLIPATTSMPSVVETLREAHRWMHDLNEEVRQAGEFPEGEINWETVAALLLEEAMATVEKRTLDRTTNKFWNRLIDNETVFRSWEGKARLLWEEAKSELRPDEQNATALLIELAARRLSQCLEEHNWHEVDDDELWCCVESLVANDWKIIALLFVDEVRPHRLPHESKFVLGTLSTTARAEKTIHHNEIWRALNRHVRGDWGDVPRSSWRENDFSLERGYGISSRYRTMAGVTFWVITEADRSATKIALPEDY